MKKIFSAALVAGVFSTAFTMSAIAHNEGTYVTGSGNPVLSSSGTCVQHSNGGDESMGCFPQPEPEPVAAPEPAPEPAPAPEPVRYESAVSLSGDALFATNSSDISAEGISALDDLASKIAALGDVSISGITVVGHADSRGADSYNQALSERRAKSVADYLVSRGVKQSIISSQGRGESDPVASNDTSEGRAQNRRVEITLEGTKVTYK